MNGFAITLDVDWAPDYMIDHVASILAAAQVPATWFVTHSSPAIERLRSRGDLFELGIHPNLLPGSTHGSRPDEVIEHCLKLVPDAVSMRTHGLVQSSPLLAMVLRQTPIRVDSSLLLPRHPHLAPVEFRSDGKTLVRIPFYWEDDDEMECPSPSWHVRDECEGPGLRVFDFHPVHVYLNSASMARYARIKALGPLAVLEESTGAEAIFSGEGTQTFFLELVERLAGRTDVMPLRDLATRYRAVSQCAGKAPPVRELCAGCGSTAEVSQ